jgi:hypothetical protein
MPMINNGSKIDQRLMWNKVLKMAITPKVTNPIPITKVVRFCIRSSSNKGFWDIPSKGRLMPIREFP